MSDAPLLVFDGDPSGVFDQANSSEVDRVVATRQAIIAPPGEPLPTPLGSGPGQIRPVSASTLRIFVTADVNEALLVTFDGEKLKIERLASEAP